MGRTVTVACAVLLGACSGASTSSGPSASMDGGGGSDAGGSVSGSTSGGTEGGPAGSTSGGGTSGGSTNTVDGGGYGAPCGSTYTDGCDSVPGPGTAACGEDPTHCCGTRVGCAAGLTCVLATCSIECKQTTDCAAVSPAAVCVYPDSSSSLRACFDPCGDGGMCSGDLVCRPPVASGPPNCEQYVP